MDPHELNEIVKQGESERVEFKKTTGQRSEAARAVCAMLNGQGGFVLFGVTPAGKVEGQTVTSHTLEEVHNELKRIEPLPLPDVERVDLPGGNTVVALRVPGGFGGPYAYDGRPYLRNGPTTIVMPQSLYQRRLLEQMHGTQRWENQPARGVTVDDLDHREIAVTVEEAIRRHRLDEPGTREAPKLLLGLGLIQEGRLLNAAAVLFGKLAKLQVYYPHCLLRMARFRGTNKSEFIDNRQEVGNAFELFLHGQRFCRDHLPVASRIVPGRWERIDEPLYPPEAVREALANALCHRDYGVGGAVSLAIYDDRLEIGSTGVLPFGLTPADLVKPHASKPWNIHIAQTFYRRGLIETWGRGTVKIGELLAAVRLPPPEFDVVTGEVVVRLRRGLAVSGSSSHAEVNPLQRQLLQLLTRAGPCTLTQLGEQLGESTPRRTLQRALQQLRAMGLIESVGKKGRSSRWQLAGTET